MKELLGHTFARLRQVALVSLLPLFGSPVFAQTGGQPAGMTCPDDGMITCANNETGNADKVVTIDSSGTDEDFVVEIFDADAEDQPTITSVTYENGAGPPITCGPGLSARVRDPADTNSAPIKFVPTVT